MQEKKKIFYGWWIVVGSILVTATVVPSVMATAGLYQDSVVKELGINKSTFALSSTILQGLGIFVSPFISKKLANGNMKRIQNISVVLFALVFATYGLAQSPIHLYITSFVLGILFLSSAMLPVPMMVTNWFVEKKGLAMSLAMGGIGIGGAVLGPILSYCIGNFGWRKAYFIMAGIIFIIAVPTSIFIFTKKPEDKNLKPLGYSADSTQKTKNNYNVVKLGLSTKEIFKKSFFYILLFGMICNGLINTGALQQIPPALGEMHTPAIAASILSLYSLIGVFGKLLIGWINDKFGLIAAILFGGTSFTLCFISMLFAEKTMFLYGVAVFLGLGMAIGNVLPPLITSEVFGQDKYGDIYGYVNSTVQLGLSCGTLLVASIYDVSGSYKVAWMVMAIMTVLTIVSWIYSYISSKKYRINNNTKTKEKITL
ncbi:MFS transporter [Miniphocaeibacter halophilus]|uniref:MFS transporter n=1 Tax=Miniphocaeibacter halophilus TaxID=2931922 RepID=A0AC61MP36_9FIRM|nr:MFS transporter [Miniphocaeibacter halophilus]QQK07236.1 MFS transporter [Miniphocaeibacter halophilus]